jgi:crossover junction endodeoxyribonuclease RuvC
MSIAFEGRVLGIDPGLNTTGYGLIDVRRGNVRMIEAGILRMKRDSLERRLQELHESLTELIEAHRPQAMALEQLFSHYDRPRTAILMGHARGVICLAAATHGVSLHHYEPTKVKRLLTGNGRAPKSQIQMAVRLQLQLPTVPDPPDVADALALALCHCSLASQTIEEFFPD